MSYEEYRLRQENAALRNRLHDQPPTLEEKLRWLKEEMAKGRIKILPMKTKPRR